MPNNLTIVFNITKYPGEELADRIKYLGPAVQERISKIIAIEYFTPEEYLEYVRYLLKEYRATNKIQHKDDPYFPFEEDCLKYLFDTLRASPTNLHPRTVNKLLTAILQWGLKEKISPITKQFVEKHADELAMAMK